MPITFFKYKYWQFIIAFVFLTLNGFSQNASVWEFGGFCRLVFEDQVTSEQGNIMTNEGVSCFSNDYGELLFSTNGENVWNAEGEQVNVQTILGHKSSTQSSLILPDPNDENEYYIFTTGAIESNATSGILAISKVVIEDDEIEVVSNMDIPIFPTNNENGFSCSERLSAIEKCNGQGYWVVTHDDGRFEANNQNFYVFDVSEFGIEMMPAQSFGFNHQYGNENSVGQIKFSSDGRKLALVNRGDENIYVYDFDSSTGWIDENSEWLIEAPFEELYGVEFSPNSEFIYFTTASAIYRKSVLDIEQDPELIEVSIGQVVQSDLWALQLGPDGHIYVAQSGHDFIGRISTPDDLEVEFEPDAIPLAEGAVCNIGLPSFIQTSFDRSIDFDFNRMGCSKIVEFIPESLNDQTFQFEWEYDSQVSYDASPIHLFSDFGIHEASLKTTKTDGCSYSKTKFLDLVACEEYSSQYEDDVSTINGQGFNDSKKNIEISLYPNPLSMNEGRVLNIQSEYRIDRIKIFDGHSKMICSKTATSCGSRNHQIQMEDDLPSGLYFVIVTLENSKEVSLKLTIAG